MLFADELVVVRGGGDLATGVTYRLRAAGLPVVICELAAPMTVRRTVALSSAVLEGEVVVEGVVGRRVDDLAVAADLAQTGVVPVLVSRTLPALPASVVVDARMTKHRGDTSPRDAPLVVALGPGFTAPVDCHAVIETMRGGRLGRVIWDGAAAPDTGTPGRIGGRAADRVLRAPISGRADWDREIGTVVEPGQTLGRVGSQVITAPFSGVIRGLISPMVDVAAGTKIGDVDPRLRPETCHEISDKALAVGGGTVEAVLTHLGRSRS